MAHRIFNKNVQVLAEPGMKTNPMIRLISGTVTKYLLVGLLIRELFSFWTGHTYDFEIWVRLGVYMQHFGNPYTTLPYVQGLSFAPYPVTGSISYPPLSAFIFAGIYRLYLSSGIASRFFYYFLLKQPMVISDFASGLLLGQIALHSLGTESAKRVLKIWMIFPFAIVISSIWGALDPVALFLVLSAVYYFQKGKTVLPGIALGLAIFLKTLPVIALPVLLMQPGTSLREGLKLSSISLLIPIAGTLVPAVGLGWGFNGLFNNVSYQVVIPAYGALSAFGPVGLLPVPSWGRSITGLIWLPALLLAYFYTYRRRFGLIEGLLTAFLVFSVSRPFLPEQWAIYPLALLLLSRNTIENFVGLGTAAFLALLSNNTLLVKFFTPVFVSAFNWEYVVNNLSPYGYPRAIVTFLLAGLFLMESTFILSGRQSMTFQALSSASLKARRVFQLEIWKVRRA
jgi:hypothetical protein